MSKPTSCDIDPMCQGCWFVQNWRRTRSDDNEDAKAVKAKKVKPKRWCFQFRERPRGEECHCHTTECPTCKRIFRSQSTCKYHGQHKQVSVPANGRAA